MGSVLQLSRDWPFDCTFLTKTWVDKKKLTSVVDRTKNNIKSLKMEIYAGKLLNLVALSVNLPNNISVM